jgi:hypothetical protein
MELIGKYLKNEYKIPLNGTKNSQNIIASKEKGLFHLYETALNIFIF